MVLVADDASRAATAAWAAAGPDAGPPPPRRVDRGAVLKEGDAVVIFEGRDRLRQVVVTRGETYQNQYGVFFHDDWIGLPYGSRVVTRNGGGRATLLAPTPELWTRCLRHRTQVLYPADIALATSFMELAPGSVVLECGTGSGSLTHALARAVHPGGSVHTFEFHAGRAAAAAAEFEAHGLAGVVVGHVRDVQAAGFGAAFEAATADAVFLDLPAPWAAVPSAAACLRPDGVLCSFSPCVEQVQRTCAALARSGAFTAPATHELLLRGMDVRREKLVTDVVGGGGGGRGKRARAAAVESEQADGDGDGDGDDDDDAGAAKRAGVVVAKPDAVARGHTGYLTFARRAVE